MLAVPTFHIQPLDICMESLPGVIDAFLRRASLPEIPQGALQEAMATEHGKECREASQCPEREQATDNPEPGSSLSGQEQAHYHCTPVLQ